MYEEHFGTDWTELDGREEAIRRAFALGVAARMDQHYPGELDRISDAVESSYDRSFVELAYHEGRDKASELDPDPEDDVESVWNQVVQGEGRYDPAERPEVDPGDTPEGIPEAMGRVNIDTRPGDSREATERPKFLSREEAEEPDRRQRRSRRARREDDEGDGEATEQGDESEEGPTAEERAEFESILDPDDEDS